MISWLTEPGDGVYDPFSGRGTVALEAALLGREAFSSDANPLASVLTQAKTVIPSRGTLSTRLARLEAAYLRASIDVSGEPSEIRMLYSDGTLKQLVFLKRELDAKNNADCFLIATTLGMLHANHGKDGATRGFSISMPNTFAMAPGYVERYIKDHQLAPPEVNVFAMLRRRIDKLDLPERQRTAGRAWQQDATMQPPGWLRKQSVRLVVTSPPYLQVIKYGKYNWVRLWFLGANWREVDSQLMASASMDRYVEFMTSVCSQLSDVVTPDGYLCFVIGDVRRPTKGDEEASINLASVVWERVARPLGWHLHGIIADDFPEGRKVSRIWKNNTGRATKTDRLLLMSPTPTALPPIVTPTWSKPTLQPQESAA